MATMTPVRETASGAHRADLRAARVARHRRRIRLSAACYAGIVLLVGLAVVMARTLPAALGIPAFVVLVAAVVMLAHPALHITARR